MTEMNTIESATNLCVENMREQNITLACENMQRWTFSWRVLMWNQLLWLIYEQKDEGVGEYHFPYTRLWRVVVHWGQAFTNACSRRMEQKKLPGHWTHANLSTLAQLSNINDQNNKIHEKLNYIVIRFWPKVICMDNESAYSRGQPKSYISKKVLNSVREDYWA